QLAALMAVHGRDRHAGHPAAAAPHLDEHLRLDFVPGGVEVDRTQRVSAKHAISALGVSDRDADERRQGATADPVRPITVRRHGRTVELPLADDHLGAGLVSLLQQTRRLLRKMLSIAIKEQHVREVVLEYTGQPRSHGMTLSEIPWMHDD